VIVTMGKDRGDLFTLGDGGVIKAASSPPTYKKIGAYCVCPMALAVYRRLEIPPAWAGVGNTPLEPVVVGMRPPRSFPNVRDATRQW
jgi:hypothetical protein